MLPCIFIYIQELYKSTLRINLCSSFMAHPLRILLCRNHLCIQREKPWVNYRFAYSLQCRLHISILHCAYVSYNPLPARYSRTTAIWLERASLRTKAIWRNGALVQRIIQHKNIFCIDYRLSTVHVLTSLIFLLLFLACFKQIFFRDIARYVTRGIYNDAIKYRIIFIKTRRSIKTPCDAHNRWSNTSNASTHESGR